MKDSRCWFHVRPHLQNSDTTDWGMIKPAASCQRFSRYLTKIWIFMIGSYVPPRFLVLGPLKASISHVHTAGAKYACMKKTNINNGPINIKIFLP